MKELDGFKEGDFVRLRIEQWSLTENVRITPKAIGRIWQIEQSNGMVNVEFEFNIGLVFHVRVQTNVLEPITKS